jgi:hypothetical protein
LFETLNLGFENPGMTGGEGSPFALFPLLLGGVLNGDTSAASDDVSGARFERTGGSADCGFGAILGFPARLTGGGTGGADEVDPSRLRGSLEDPLPVVAGRTGFESNAGVELRLGIFQNREPLDADPGVDGVSRAACEVGREGRGESI